MITELIFQSLFFRRNVMVEAVFHSPFFMVGVNPTIVTKKRSVAYQKLSPVPSGEERGIILFRRDVRFAIVQHVAQLCADLWPVSVPARV